MKFNFEETKIYVRPGATDLRKGVGGTSGSNRKRNEA